MTVVPTATTRPPAVLVSRTQPCGRRRDLEPLGCGASPASWDETPVCRVIGAIWIPRATSVATRSEVNGRAADGISALPGRTPKTDW